MLVLISVALAVAGGAVRAHGDSRGIVPAARVSPDSFVSLQAADFAAGAADVHAVLLYSGDPAGDGSEVQRPPLAVAPYPGHPAVATVEVSVTASARPVMLVLGSHATVHWSLSVAPQARVEKIVAEGYYQQFVSGVPPGAKVSTYYRYPEAGVDALYNTTEPGHLYTLFQNVGRLTGKRPTTL